MDNLELKITPKSDKRIKILMKYHYSKPKGFVGRSICYAIYYDDVYYGHIVGGSATLHLPNRNKYVSENNLNLIVNNVFFFELLKRGNIQLETSQQKL